MTTDDDELDVIVVGSGAAGMTAALTAAHPGLRTRGLEKTDRFGGPAAPPGRPRHGQDLRPDGAHAPARAPHAQHGPGPGGGPAGGPGGPGRAGVARHSNDRPAS